MYSLTVYVSFLSFVNKEIDPQCFIMLIKVKLTDFYIDFYAPVARHQGGEEGRGQ